MFVQNVHKYHLMGSIPALHGEFTKPRENTKLAKVSLKIPRLMDTNNQNIQKGSRYTESPFA